MSYDNCITKICSTWKQEFPATTEHFGTHKQGKYGLRSICKPCRQISNKRYQENNKEEIKERQQGYRKLNAISERNRVREWRLGNLDRINTRDRAYRKLHPETARARGVNARARKCGVPGSITGEQIKTLLALQENTCYYCGYSLDGGYHVDHYIPLSRGGINTANNIRLSCYRCSQSKSNKLPAEWGGRF